MAAASFKQSVAWDFSYLKKACSMRCLSSAGGKTFLCYTTTHVVSMWCCLVKATTAIPGPTSFFMALSTSAHALRYKASCLEMISITVVVMKSVMLTALHLARLEVLGGGGGQQ